MKCLLLFFLITTILPILISTKSCETPVKECEPTEYMEYVKCMRERTKRDTDCQDYDDECNDCEEYDCDSCNYSVCENSCPTCCSRCCNTINTCTSSHCCSNICHASCGDHKCRSSCKKTCRERLYKKDQSTSTTVREKIDRTVVNQASAPHNITTVIHLSNLINNTNLINIPITVNNTNLNNFTQRSSFGSYGGGGGVQQQIIYRNSTEFIDQSNCCQVVGPRQCVPQEKFPFIRCFHIRRRQCGRLCQSPVLHYQQYEICDNEVQQPQPEQPCNTQTVYIPQPQPRCAYSPTWPYVVCGGGNQKIQSCEGCYNHYSGEYGTGQCSPYCYDDGFGVGPYYRQGPFYRPGYAHVPSCYQTGQCSGLYGNNFNNMLPWNGVGYPQNSYEVPFIIDENGNSTISRDGSFVWDNPEPILNYASSFPTQYWPVGTLPKDVSIEANVQSPRGTRFAEIKITKEDSAKENEADDKQDSTVNPTTTI